jgi:hypothetical protein
MPIRATERPKYGPDWQETRQRVLNRATDCCEECGVRNHAWGWRDHGGMFHGEDTAKLQKMGHRRTPFLLTTNQGPMKIIRIVLTVSHQDHNPSNNDLGNLKALCQRCHLRYDQELHRQTRRVQRN